MTDTAPGSSSGLDKAAALVLLALQGAGAALCVFLGVSLVFVSDACDSQSCDTGLILAGMAITGLVPGLLWVASLIHLIARFRAGALAWWVPLAWGAASGVAAAIGIAVAFSGGPNSFG